MFKKYYRKYFKEKHKDFEVLIVNNNSSNIKILNKKLCSYNRKQRYFFKEDRSDNE